MIINSMIIPPYNSKMAANESVFLRRIRDVVGEVLRDLQASVTERAFYRLDWLLDVVSRYADSLNTTTNLHQIHFLLREARECLCAHSGSFAAQIAFLPNHPNKVLAESDTCFKVLKIPTRHSDYKGFVKYMDISITQEKVGFGKF